MKTSRVLLSIVKCATSMLLLAWLQMYFIVKVQGQLLDKEPDIDTEKDRRVKKQVKRLSCDFFLVGGKTSMIIDDDLVFISLQACILFWLFLRTSSLFSKKKDHHRSSFIHLSTNQKKIAGQPFHLLFHLSILLRVNVRSFV